jgi:DNA-binding transcriptional regulator YiaG
LEEVKKYQLFPALTAEEYSELKEDIAQRGVQVPVEKDEAGNILDGHHRVRACEELGITDYPVIVRANMTEEEKRLHIRKLNLARRHLTAEQRRNLIAEQVKETPEMSDRQIAKELGVSHPTVGTVRKELEEKLDVVNFTTSSDTLGRKQKRKRSSRKEEMQTIMEVPARELTSEDYTHIAEQVNNYLSQAQKLLEQIAGHWEYVRDDIRIKVNELGKSLNSYLIGKTIEYTVPDIDEPAIPPIEYSEVRIQDDMIEEMVAVEIELHPKTAEIKIEQSAETSEGSVNESGTMTPDEIKNLREKMKLTQRDFAKRLDVYHVMVHRWEHGEERPSADFTRKMQELSKELK